MLDVRKLELFARVVGAGSFTAAANQLYLTQSAVSQQIGELEAGLGVKLFERGRRGVVLTAAGETLYTYTQRILQLVAEAENAVTDVTHLQAGQVRIGATPGASVYLLPQMMQSFRERYPRLTVALQTGTTPQVLAALQAGQIDVGLIEGEIEERWQALVEVRALDDVEQFVVVGSRHAWWGRHSVALSELAGQPLIVRQQSSQTRAWLDHVLQEHGIIPTISAEFDNVESIKRAVAAGLCATILPHYVTAQEEALGWLRSIPVEGNPLRRVLKLVWDKAAPLSPIARALLSHEFSTSGLPGSPADRSL
ncbi:MAG: LysR family transcriptional regulator [Chloroflexota bacterium]|nr:LysR family transcriptional regulator [Chloroflexota bacterium]